MDKKALIQREKAQKLIQRAKKKADKLVRSWLSDTEYNALKHEDGLRIKSKFEENTEYLVKPLSYQRVEKYVNGELKQLLCMVDKQPGFENDDTVLHKILMLKTNEKQFLEIAVKTNV